MSMIASFWNQVMFAHLQIAIILFFPSHSKTHIVDVKYIQV